jgi:alcohol dehydrogenase (cytochrome c)
LRKSIKRLLGAGVVLVIVAAIAAAIAFRSLSHGLTLEMITWRAKLFARKAEGRLPGLSWREFWFMTHVRGGFGLEGVTDDGFSLEGAVENPFVTDADHQIGARAFRQHCGTCHGKVGGGGFGPPLNHPGLGHGDSDLAIYKVIRDGIPATAMPRIAMPVQERWQLVGFLRALQVANAGQQAESGVPVGLEVTSQQIREAGSKTDQWLTYSGSLNGHRYTPLAEITPQNVARLRVRWVHQFITNESSRSEATPLVIDKTIFLTEPPANVVALDGATGAVMWRYSRNVPDKLPICCARSNRGLAILGNVLFFGSLDGYLIAINAVTGNVIWDTEVCSPSNGFTMTGAPLIVNDSIVVGVAGGEYGVRGFLADYDAKTGQQRWKFNTIPGPGEFGHDTWKSDAWKTGGGPTWVTGSYDPSLDLVYWGVGNPAPNFLGDIRSGDNLFTDSVIALNGSSGKLAWYFQFTPHDEHDWDAAQTPVLADLPIKGVPRKVLCTADRNGFYYVLDRTSGEFLVGVPFVAQNWAKGLDSRGRPILTENAEVSVTGRLTRPGVAGGINWQNTAFDQKRGLIFVPATEGASVFTKSEDAEPARGDQGLYPGSSGSASQQPDPVIKALDAATGEKKWEMPLPPWEKSFGYGYSGLLATGGGLVFGSSGGYTFAIDSENGHEMWRVFLGADTYAAPISFTLDGHQVIAVSAGRALYVFGL